MKTIAIDLDDTLNNFTATLQRTAFLRRGRAYSAEVFEGYLAKLRRGADDDEVLLGTDISFPREDPPAVLPAGRTAARRDP